MLTTTPLPRLQSPSIEEFTARCLEPRQPAIISGWMSDWPALRAWSLDYFRVKYGDCQVNTIVDLPTSGTFFSHREAPHARTQALRDFVNLIESRERVRPCYLNGVTVSSLAGLSADIQFPQLGPVEDTKNLLWLGPEGTRLSFHVDFLDNFLAQVVGVKRLLVVSPDDSPAMYPSVANISESMVDSESPDLSAWPAFSRAQVREGTIQAGEMIFLPCLWWHEVRSLSPSISVNHFFPPAASPDYRPILRACTAKHYAHAAWQFVVHGALGRTPRERLYSPKTTGKLIWDEVVRVARSRLVPRPRGRSLPDASS
jgi:lysine-specific demethylase 8